MTRLQVKDEGVAGRGGALMHSRSVVIHIPHGATFIPGFLRQKLMLDAEALRPSSGYASIKRVMGEFLKCLCA